MRLLKQAAGALGTLVVVIVIAALLTPKTAHAVFATLVQVANTSANPVPTIDSLKSASQIVELRCGFTIGPPNQCSGKVHGTFESPFKVPAGQSFVVTSIDTTANPPKFDTVQLEVDAQDSSGNDLVLEFYVLSTSTTAELQFPAGIVYESGLTPFFVEFGNTPVSVTVHGYLTSN